MKLLDRFVMRFWFGKGYQQYLAKKEDAEEEDEDEVLIAELKHIRGRMI